MYTGQPVDKMKHAKRMILVQKTRLIVSITAGMMHKDTELSNILHRTVVADAEKQKCEQWNII